MAYYTGDLNGLELAAGGGDGGGKLFMCSREKLWQNGWYIILLELIESSVQPDLLSTLNSITRFQPVSRQFGRVRLTRHWLRLCHVLQRHTGWTKIIWIYMKNKHNCPLHLCSLSLSLSLILIKKIFNFLINQYIFIIHYTFWKHRLESTSKKLNKKRLK